MGRERRTPCIRVSPERLSLESRVALMALKRALADEGYIAHVQVTFDNVAALDVPPTLDVIPVSTDGDDEPRLRVVRD